MLISLIKRPELGADDKGQIFELLATPGIRQDNIYSSFDHSSQIKEIKEALKSQLVYDKVNGIMNLISTFSFCSDLEEQLDIFTKRLPELLKKSLTDVNEKGKDVLELIGHIAECMIFQCEFLVKIPKEVFESPTEEKKNATEPLLTESDLQSQEGQDKILTDEKILEVFKLVPYRLPEQELNLKSCDNIYPALSIIIEAFLKFPDFIEVQNFCLDILQRLYYMFPKFRKNIEEHIITVFSNINQRRISS